MIVCHCRGVTDCTVRLAIEAGAHDVDTLAMWAGAGARCSGCRTALQALLQEMSRPAAPSEGVSSHSASPYLMNTFAAPATLSMCHGVSVESGAPCDRQCGARALAGEEDQASRQVG